MTKIVYSYNKDTKEYAGETVADRDPMDSTNWLMPAYTTEEEPIEAEEGYTNVWDGSSWTPKKDLRGSVYWNSEGKSICISNIGEEIPEDALLSEPKESIELAEATYIRSLRDKLLAKVSIDIEIRLDNSLEVGDWRAYRQFLRDIPEQEGFPEDVDWGIYPS